MRIILPIKDLQTCKSRLASALDVDARASLMTALATDALQAAQQSKLLCSCYVVSHDPQVHALAKQYGAEVIDLPDDVCLNSGVTAALKHLPLMISPTLIVHADIPALSARNLDNLIARHTIAGVDLTLVPDVQENGTNAMVLSGGRNFRFHYGEQSFSKHLRQAELSSLRHQRLAHEAFAYDIDVSSDLARLATVELPAGSALADWRAKHLSLPQTSATIRYIAAPVMA